MTTEPLKLRAIISGGQSGVMRAALDIALDLGIPHGGIAPPLRAMDDGVLAPRYELVEAGDRSHYKLAVHNIKASDGTLIITRATTRPFGRLDHMSEYVRGLATKHGKPTLHVVIDDPSAERLVPWLCEFRIAVVNVHGPREVRVQKVRADRTGNQNYQPGIALEAKDQIAACLRAHVQVIRANALAHARSIKAESTVTSSDVVPAQTAPARPREPEPHGPPLAPTS